MQLRGLLVRMAALPSSKASSHRCYGAEAAQTSLIKQLREKTNAPIKDVKAALVQCDWNPEVAFTELRKLGLAAANKKASRVAADGLLGLAEENGAAAIVEINTETDFVARNEIFQHLVSRVAKAALSIDAYSKNPQQAAIIDAKALEEKKIVLEHPKLNGETNVCDAIREAAALMGENIKLRRGFRLSTSSGVVSSYLHMSQQAGLARIGGLVTLEVEKDDGNTPLEPLRYVGASLAMHVVAARPLFLSKDHATSEVLQRERDIFRSQAILSNKPEAMIEKMVEGKLAKYMEDVALLEQKYVMNDKVNIRTVLNNLSKEVGKPVNIGCFLRLEVGEGIERDSSGVANVANCAA